MPVIAIVNRKGGSGKSTLAAHLAACYASNGVAVMLGDVDRQQSTQSWLRLRGMQPLQRGVPIVGWAVDPKRVLRPPAGVSLVVLDTPGGLHGFDLARVVAFADVILMPVCNSAFDRESAADCHAELMALPRVASGRCKVAAVGMRLDARTKAGEVLAAWARGLKLPFIGVLREAQVYVRSIEQGLTLFDLPAEQVQADLAQWKTIVEWLEPVLRIVHRPTLRRNPGVVRPEATSSRLGDLASGRIPLERSDSEAAAAARVRTRATLVEPARRTAAHRVAGWFGWLVATPRFLQRHS